MKRGWLVGVFTALVLFGAFPNQSVDAGTPIYGVVTSKGKGFDKCGAATKASMDTWWSSSPFYYVGVYIGGSNRGCPNTIVDQDWISHNDSTGWAFIPIWVGPQPPCTNFGDKFSSNTDTAREQGHTVGGYTKDRMIELGMFAPGDGSMGPIAYYDLEAYDTTNQNCRDATKAFIAGWVSEMHQWHRRAGLYGSSCGSALDDFWGIDNKPDDVWIARYTSDNPSVYNVTCVPDSHWEYSRLRQHTQNVSATYGGVTLNPIDKNCARGDVTKDATSPYGDDADCYKR
jgi:glycoside hydrolase-like protein